MKSVVRFGLLAWLFLGLFTVVRGDEPAEQAERAARRQKMVARIDEHILARLKAEGVTPAARSTDEEFLRRTNLDLTGVVPRLHAAREFLADERPDKRAQLIDTLLASPQHATHLANTWRNLLLPNGLSAENVGAATGMQRWLRNRFASNLRYDNLVSDLLIATEGDTTGPALYFTSLELAPEKLAASSAKNFLGLQLECAQCHDHPFDAWKQKDFWGYAAFFARLQRPDGRNPGGQQRVVDVDKGEVMLPNTSDVVPPKYIGGDQAKQDEPGSRRLQLAIWIASRDNPYLAPAAVNRVWHLLFGRGLVEPVDDLSPQNKPTHPELFRELTDYFIESGFDLRELFRTIMLTETYQRTSRWSEGELPAADLYAVHGVKSLTAEQMFDSLVRVVGYRSPTAMNGEQDGERLQFLAKLQTPNGSPLEYHAGILQALTLMNGQHAAAQTDPKASPILMSLGAPWLADKQQIDALFLSTLSRPPTSGERELLEKELAAAAKNEHSAVLSDALWAILNSAEFGLNH